mmetsp:Transcript_96568/g.288257  ORF Transcript_96568/g.288257 Transcript_96568/m.288257 type:complete len:294 (-) Transcript_96568:194-1075(-)
MLVHGRQHLGRGPKNDHCMQRRKAAIVEEVEPSHGAAGPRGIVASRHRPDHRHGREGRQASHRGELEGGRRHPSASPALALAGELQPARQHDPLGEGWQVQEGPVLEPRHGAPAGRAHVRPGVPSARDDEGLHRAGAHQVERGRGDGAAAGAPQAGGSPRQGGQDKPPDEERGKEPGGRVEVVRVGSPQLHVGRVQRLQESEVRHKPSEAVGRYLSAEICEGQEQRQHVDRVDGGKPPAHESGPSLRPVQDTPAQQEAAEQEEERYPTAAPVERAVQPPRRVPVHLVVVEGHD